MLAAFCDVQERYGRHSCILVWAHCVLPINFYSYLVDIDDSRYQGVFVFSKKCRNTLSQAGLRAYSNIICGSMQRVDPVHNPAFNSRKIPWNKSQE